MFGKERPQRPSRGVIAENANRSVDERFAELHRQHADRISRFVRRRSAAALVDDIVADVFVSLYKEMIRGTEPSEGWLYMVARRRIVDHWRSEERLQRVVTRLHQASRSEAGYDTIDDVLWVDQMLGTLNARQREALFHRYVRDTSLEEVAKSLQISERAAESLLARGRRSLAQSVRSVAS